MKKVLLLGGSGTIGLCLIKYLLSEGKYNITVLDLHNKRVYKNLKKYNKRIKIIYGDILDRSCLEPLIKENDIIINLVTCLPPLSEYKKELSKIIECDGNDNIIKSINYYNSNAQYIYISSTSINNKDMQFNISKKISEERINKKIKNYIIIRLPLILPDLRYEPFIYNIYQDEMVEVISKEDAAYAITSTLNNINKLNKNIISIGGGKTCQTKYKDLLIKILKYHGISFKFIFSRIFGIRGYTSPILEDTDKYNKILNYRNDSIDSYFMRQKRRSKNRKLNILFGKLILIFYKNK